MKFIFDPIYTVKGWFSRLLSAAGWFSAELGDDDVAAPAVEGDISVTRGLASENATGLVIDVAGTITVTRGLALEDITAELTAAAQPVVDEDIGGGYAPRRVPRPRRPYTPPEVLVGRILVTRSLAISQTRCRCQRKKTSGTIAGQRLPATTITVAVVDNDEQWIIAVA